MVELLLGAIIVLVVVSMLVVGIKFLSASAEQNQLFQIQRDAQIIAYQISRDIRNSSKIEDIFYDKSPESGFNLHRLVLKSYDVSKGYDHDLSNIFSPENVVLIVYEFEEDPNDTWLYRRVINEMSSEVLSEKRYLRNLIKSEGPLFSVFPPGSEVPIAVQVNLRLGEGWFKDNPKTYSIQAMTRSIPVDF